MCVRVHAPRLWCSPLAPTLFLLQNHEVVINTLHQILMEAVASHGGPSSGATTTTVDIPMDVVAQYAASLSADALSALRSSAGAMSDRSSSISETPSRLSVEVASVGSPPSQGMSMPGRQTAADEGIMRIGADLVREVS